MTKSTERVLSRAAWIILAMAVAFVLLVRMRYLNMPLERDEGEFAYAGQLILQGIPPYKLAYNMKLPGTYLIYAGIIAVFGQTEAGIHLGLLVVSLATTLLIFFMARELFDPITGAVAAACFAVLSTSSTAVGGAAHATHFVALFGVAGVWVLWRAIQRDRTSLFFAAGLLLGTAFLMKQQGVFLVCFGGVATLVCYVRRRPVPWLRILTLCFAFAAGAILPLAATGAWLWRAGTFDKFWFWTVQYARKYIEQVPPNLALQSAWQNGKIVIGSNWLLWLMACGGATALAAAGRPAGRRAFVLGFLLSSLLCVCPGFYFRNHYFIVLFPSLAILAGFAVRHLFDAAGRIPAGASSASDVRRPAARRDRTKAGASPKPAGGVNRGLLLAMAAVIPVAAFALPLWQYAGYFFSWSPQTACRRIYGLNPFVESPVIGDYLRNNSTPNDRIAVLGSEPQIYFYSQRKSATGYIYMYALMESHPYVRIMQNEMIDEIESAKPKFILLVSITASWLRRKDSDESIFKWTEQYVSSRYRLVGLAEIFPDGRTEYRWDEQLAGVRLQSRFNVTIYRRVAPTPDVTP